MFGAPSGARAARHSSSPAASPPASVSPPPETAGAGSAARCGRSPGRSRADPACRGAGIVEAVRQLARERLGLPGEVRLEIGRRDLHPEGALTHLPRAEVAEQRQQRPDLAARELEFGAAGVGAPLRAA